MTKKFRVKFDLSKCKKELSDLGLKHLTRGRLMTTVIADNPDEACNLAKIKVFAKVRNDVAESKYKTAVALLEKKMRIVSIRAEK